MHKRFEIQTAVADALGVISNVSIWNGRWLPIPEKFMPAISVYAIGDEAEKSAGQGNYTREEKLFVIVYMAGKDVSEDVSPSDSLVGKINNLIEEIETILNLKWNTLNKTVYRMDYVATKIKIDTKADNLTAIAEMEYSAIWHETLT